MKKALAELSRSSKSDKEKVNEPSTLARTHRNSGKIFDFCSNNIDTTVITRIELQNSRLVQLGPRKTSMI